MNNPLPETHETGTEEETRALGRQLGEQAGPGTVFLLSGYLGAGKTCLVMGIAAGLGLDPDRVHSPSFIMVNRYEGNPPLHHVDLYRLEPGEDLSDLGLEELFQSPGVTAIEWSERLPAAALPLSRIEVSLSHAGGERRRIEIRRISADAA